MKATERISPFVSCKTLLDKIITGEAKLGSLKLCESKKGIWYALISVSREVPDAGDVIGWIGVDRGQNNIAVAVLPKSFGKFWKGGRVKALRRQFQRTRKSFQKAKQLKEVKRLEQRERRIMTHINHVISKELVAFASHFGMGLRFEDLTGCRQTMKQRKKTKSDSEALASLRASAANNRDSWAFYQLERLDVREWTCSHCGTCHDRDGNAATNIRVEGIRLLQVDGTSISTVGREVRPQGGRKSVLRHSLLSTEAQGVAERNPE